VGGQQGRTVRDVLQEARRAGLRVRADIVDKLIAGRVHDTNIYNEHFDADPDLRIIQGDAGNLGRVDASLRASGREGLPRYDLVLFYGILGVAFDPFQLLAEAWDQLEVGGRLVCGFMDKPSLVEHAPMSLKGQMATTTLLETLRETGPRGVRALDEEAWKAVAKGLPDVGDLTRGGSYVSFEELLDRSGIRTTHYEKGGKRAHLVLIKDTEANPFRDLPIVGLRTFQFHMDAGAPGMVLRRGVRSPYVPGSSPTSA
jgi:hypothetical protein